MHMDLKETNFQPINHAPTSVDVIERPRSPAVVAAFMSARSKKPVNKHSRAPLYIRGVFVVQQARARVLQKAYRLLSGQVARARC